MLKKQIDYQLSELDLKLETAKFIGFPANVISRIYMTARTNGLESAIHMNSLIAGEITNLSNQFDDLALTDRLVAVKAEDPARFRCLWRAKFGKEPTSIDIR